MDYGILYRSGDNLINKLTQFIKESESIYIFSAFIKVDALDYLISQSNSVKFICVRWKIQDLINGASDIDIYPYLKKRGIALYMNQRLHLKAWLDNNNRAFIGSANISNKALALGNNSNFNYEIGTTIENISFLDRLYFSIIENESILITDSIYLEIKKIVEKRKKDHIELEQDIITSSINKHCQNYLITSLPMSYNVETLYEVYTNGTAEDPVTLNCAIHDIALYNLELGLGYDEFMNTLTDKFYNHPFIKGFIQKIAERGEIYFGEAKEWIQKNCTTVPTPRRWQLNENVQILYRWIVILGQNYIVNVPGRHSQRLMINR